KEETGREPEPRPAAPGLAGEPEVGEREGGGEKPERDIVRDAELLEPVRQRELRLLVRVPRQRAEGAEPVPAELGARNHYNDESGGGEAEVPDPPALRPRFERPQRQEDDGDPLDEDRARPRRSRPVAATGCCERQSRHH